MTAQKFDFVRKCLLLLLTSCLIPSIRAETIDFNLITDPKLCFSDIECPSNYSCFADGYYAQYQCVPRSALNEPCDTNPFRSAPTLCQSGLFCSSKICRPLRKLGQRCTLSSDCIPPYYCELTDNKCRKLGELGAACEYDEECNIDGGFYCNLSKKKCVPRKSPGKPCDPDDPLRCAGYCDYNSRKCFATKAELEPCTTREQCTRFPHRKFGRIYDDALCNIAKGSIGICVTESRLLKSLGARCSVKKDMCDARRGLSCRWSVRLRKAVCQQKNKPGDEAAAYCTPGNALSTCINNRWPRGCRLEEIDYSDPDGHLVRLYYRCLRAYETVPRGAICNRVDYARCEVGTSCRPIAGVSELPYRTRPLPLATCVVVRNLGESCAGSKFKTQCEDGLHCEHGVCVEGAQKETPYTHADISDDCSKLPCVPGTICQEGFNIFSRECSFPTKTVSNGQLCYNRARFYIVSLHITHSLLYVRTNLDTQNFTFDWNPNNVIYICLIIILLFNCYLRSVRTVRPVSRKTGKAFSDANSWNLERLAFHILCGTLNHDELWHWSVFNFAYFSQLSECHNGIASFAHRPF